MRRELPSLSSNRILTAIQSFGPIRKATPRSEERCKNSKLRSAGNAAAIAPRPLTRTSTPKETFGPPQAATPGAVLMAEDERVTFVNSRRETLVGKLVDTGSRGAIILCHGLSSHKDGFHLPALAQALKQRGISSLRIDFSGNGESEGVFHYANIKDEADDIQAAADFLKTRQKQTTGLLGHSKAGSSVLLYAAEHSGNPKVVNVSGRFDHKQGLKERFGYDVCERVKQGGGIECTSKSAVRGTFKWTFTEQDLEERLQLDMAAQCARINPAVAILTIHGSDDQRIPVMDARRYAAQLPGSRLHVIEGADHNFSAREHHSELVRKAVEFLTEDQVDAAARSAAGSEALGGLAAAVAEQASSTCCNERITFTNADGLELVGTLVDTGSKEAVILCHGMADNSNAFHLPALADALRKKGVSSLRFDFRGNGKSQGTFRFGNMKEEAEDIRAAFLFLQNEREKQPRGLLGHSKAGCGVIIYTAKYGDIPAVVNVAGRFDCKKGIMMRFGEDIFDRLELDGGIEVGWRTASGPLDWVLTKEDMDARLACDMAAECSGVPQDVSVLTIHGTKDTVIPVADGQSIADRVPGGRIHIIENADHNFEEARHAAEMIQVATDFLLSSLKGVRHVAPPESAPRI